MSTAPASFRPGDPVVERPARGRWSLAFVLALLLHAGSGAVVGWVGLPTARPLAASTAAPISFVFSPSPGGAGSAATTAQQPDGTQPTRFTELPPDRADVAPERPDFLSNIDSRARDRREGGDAESLPYMEGRSDSPQVAMTPAGAPAEPAAAGAADRATDADAALAGDDAADPQEGAPDPKDVLAPGQTPAVAGGAVPGSAADRAVAERGSTRRSTGRRSRPGDARDDLRATGSGRAVPSLLQQLGMSDIYQEEMNNLLGNALEFGGVSLNTTAWNFAPWVQRFLRDVRRNWVAPYAYHLGVIDGYTQVQIEIAPDGRMLQAQVVDQQGHESLHQASLAAVHSAAPFQPLPADFPEPTLVLHLKMTYLPPPPR